MDCHRFSPVVSRTWDQRNDENLERDSDLYFYLIQVWRPESLSIHLMTDQYLGAHKY